MGQHVDIPRSPCGVFPARCAFFEWFLTLAPPPHHTTIATHLVAGTHSLRLAVQQSFSGWLADQWEARTLVTTSTCSSMASTEPLWASWGTARLSLWPASSLLKQPRARTYVPINRVCVCVSTRGCERCYLYTHTTLSTFNIARIAWRVLQIPSHFCQCVSLIQQLTLS